MQKSSQNKMVGSADIRVRDKFIVEKTKQGFSPTEIREVLLPREGFHKVARSRIYQILESNGVKPRGN